MVAYVSQIFSPTFAMPYMKFLTNCNITEHGYENICVFLSVTFYKNIISNGGEWTGIPVHL